MARVWVSVNGRKYQIACEDGQEAHVSRLASYVDRRIGELVASVGQVGDAQLLVMASLLIADELDDAVSEVDRLRKAGERPVPRVPAEDSLAPTIDDLAERIETIARRLKHI